jgi:hypothetical protein
MDRIILQKLLDRLEKEIGPVEQGFFSAWEGDEENLAVRTAAGMGHFAQAVLYAREALASGDDEQIRTAAQICPTFERTGRELHEAAEKSILKKNRMAGGNTTGKRLADNAKLRWAHYVDMFKCLIMKGEGTPIARRLVITKMIKDEFVDPVTGKFPSKTTINKRLVT